MLTFSLNTDCTDIKYSKLDLNPRTQEGREYLANFFVSVLLNRNKTNNADAYGKRSAENNYKTKLKREVSLVTVEEMEKGKSEVSLQNSLPEVMFGTRDGNLERVEERDELEKLLDDLRDMQEYMETEAGVNLILLMNRATEGNIDAINLLRDLIETFKMEEMMEKLLSTQGWRMAYKLKYPLSFKKGEL